jgi:hypothetical protein
MGERRDGLGGRDAAGLVGDAVMSAVDQVVERLRSPEHAPGPPLPPAEPRSGAVEPGGRAAAALPAGVVELVGALDRVDVQRLVDRVDVDELAGRIDLDALLARVDMDAVVRRLDIAAVAREALDAVDIGEIVRESTATIGTDIVDDIRLQAIRADRLLARWADAVLRRRDPRETALRRPGTPG